jgi:hypothetical protein
MPSRVDTLMGGEPPRPLLVPVDPDSVSPINGSLHVILPLTRIGFSGQFISDALTALGSEVMSGDAMYYRTWFREFFPPMTHDSHADYTTSQRFSRWRSPGPQVKSLGCSRTRRRSMRSCRLGSGCIAMRDMADKRGTYCGLSVDLPSEIAR